MRARIKLFDIAANLTYKTLRPNLEAILKRARTHGVEKFLILGSCLEESKKSYDFSLLYSNTYCSAGVHPCQALKPQEDKDYFSELEKIIKEAKKDKLVAIGECGLDYDRLSLADKDSQLKVFPEHFELAKKYNLPMYFHARNAETDFYKIVSENRSKFSTGVVHSFTGSLDLLKKLLDMGLYIGVNGCSLKTDNNISVIKQIPLDRLLLETDAPFCKITKKSPVYKLIKTHFKQKKVTSEDPYTIMSGRNEPCTLIQVLEVVAVLKGLEGKALAKIVWNNSLKLFNIT